MHLRATSWTPITGLHYCAPVVRPCSQRSAHQQHGALLPLVGLDSALSPVTNLHHWAPRHLAPQPCACILGPYHQPLLPCHALTAATKVHPDSQGLRSGQRTCSWPWPSPLCECLPPASATTQAPAAGPHRRVGARHPFWPSPHLPWHVVPRPGSTLAAGWELSIIR